MKFYSEEVKLYWVNQDQYCIKIGISFRGHIFKAGEEKGSKKRKTFVLL